MGRGGVPAGKTSEEPSSGEGFGWVCELLTITVNPRKALSVAHIQCTDTPETGLGLNSPKLQCFLDLAPKCIALTLPLLYTCIAVQALVWYGVNVSFKAKLCSFFS